VIPELDQAELIYFYLSGYSGNERYPIYYGNDPETNKIGLIGAATRTSLFDFDPQRFYDHDNDGIPWYIPKGAPANIPYVYFKKRARQKQMPRPGGGTRIEVVYEWMPPTQLFSYQNLTFANQETAPPDFGEIKPWYYEDPDDDSDDLIAPRQGKDFQIMCAGLEDRYDPLKFFTSLRDGTEDE
jgi:hypothetical protein